MSNRKLTSIEQRISLLLTTPEHQHNALYAPLAELWQKHLELINRLDRITHISDGYQSLAREKELTLSESMDKHLRQLEKIARISDRYQQMMHDLNLALREASTHDTLTGLPNRRLMTERLKEETERHQRNGRPFSLAMLDLDRFKMINDRFGHDIGDSVLIQVASVLDAETREHDLCGRWGGEEFLVLLPETDQATARYAMERLRQAVEQLNIRVKATDISVTASIGLAEHHAGDSYSTTINRADRALLEAKRSGRNCLLDALPSPL